MGMLEPVDKCCSLYASLVDRIESQGLYVQKSILTPPGIWMIQICFRSKKSRKIRFYRFTYNESNSCFNIEKRRFLRYEPVKVIEVRDTDNIEEISRLALEIASVTS